MLAQHKDGLGVLDAANGRWLVDPGPGAVGPDHGSLAAVQGDQLAVWDLDGLSRSSTQPLAGTWSPRAVGRHSVALVEGPAASGIYHPIGRSVTRIRLAGQERVFELPGNFEPEAFSPDGQTLYLLDYIPPRDPELYRVRCLSLTTGEIFPLATKDKQPIPPGAEETMRGQGNKAVFDPITGILFTLYTHQQGHQHTGELLGVRPGSPDVHAFIHALNLEFGWAYCIDLPRPFGESAAEGHTLALSPSGTTLHAVTAAHGVIARINPESLNILSTKTFTPMTGAASAAVTLKGELFIAAGQQLTDTSETWSPGGVLSGLALGPDGRLWSCAGESVLSLDWAARKVSSQVTVPGLQSVHAIVGG